MKWRAIGIGLAVCVAAAGRHLAPPAPGHRAGSSCEQSAMRYLCGSADKIGAAWKTTRTSIYAAGDVPDPEKIPGATDPAVSQANIGETICRPGYPQGRAQDTTALATLARRQLAVDHPGEDLAAFQLDPLIPVSLGGDPQNPRNLWLQRVKGAAGAARKDTLQQLLHGMVCAREMPLAEAQSAVAKDWPGAWKRFATPENLARFHLKRPDEEGMKLST